MNVGEIHFQAPDQIWYMLMFCIACIPLGLVLAGIVAIQQWWTGRATINVDSQKPRWLRWLRREERILAAVCYWAFAVLLALPIVSIARRQIDRFEKMLFVREKMLLVYPWPRPDREIQTADVKRFEFKPYRGRREPSYWRLVLITKQGESFLSGKKEPEEWRKALPALFEMVPEFKQIDATDYDSILR